MWQGKEQGSPGGGTNATQAAGSCLMDGLNLLHEVATGVPYLIPALGMGAETPVGTTLQCCLAGSSQVLARVQGQRHLLPCGNCQE